MKRTIRTLAAALIGVALASCHDASHPAAGEGGSDVQPVAEVIIAPVTRKTITETVTAYGTVIARPGHTHSVAVAFETRVHHFLVAPGQLVAADEPLVTIEASPASSLELGRARAAADAARKDLAETRARLALELATNQEMNAAEKAAKDAELELASLESQGMANERQVKSDIAGIVAQVYVQDGQIVAASAPLAEIVPADAIEVRLGVEPEDLGLVAPGDHIDVFPVNDPSVRSVPGTVRLVTRAVNPDTRLVDVYISLPAGTELLLGAYVRGAIDAEVHDALVVPRSALLPAEGGHAVFTAESGHAVRHIVRAGIENDTEVQVLGDELAEGDAVVTSGNYELEDGMALTVRKIP